MATCKHCGKLTVNCSGDCGRSRSRERAQTESRECQIIDQAGGLESLLDKAAERNRQHVKEENRALLSEFLAKSEEQSKAIAQEMATDLRKEFLSEIGKLRSELAPKMDGGSSVFSGVVHPQVRANSAARRSVSVPADTWRPSKVEVKGFVSEEAWLPGKEDIKDAQCKSKKECVEAAALIVSKLPQDIQRLVDISILNSYSDAYLYGRVDIPIAKAALPGSAKKVLDAVAEVLAEIDIGQHGKPLRASLELKPELKATSRTLGRAFGTLRRLGADNASMRAAYNPLSIRSLTTGRPTTAATFLDGQWSVVDKGRAQLLPAKTNEEVQQALTDSVSM